MGLVKSIALRPEGTEFDPDQGRVNRCIVNLNQIRSLAPCLGEHFKPSVPYEVIVRVTKAVSPWTERLNLKLQDHRTGYTSSVGYKRVCKSPESRCLLLPMGTQLQRSHQCVAGLLERNDISDGGWSAPVRERSGDSHPLSVGPLHCCQISSKVRQRTCQSFVIASVNARRRLPTVW
ncbi:hypothetical protein EVAR_8269_1 [Eumeta japonica]|uniref:Uncharacterized protein n=1 Tax=Eumeta variegata TaxID=151549 RepID=A0A4C1TIY5_EUMVA|nr:hypothetical protein EVAR_8269_1 [Eumeta japonica]